MKYLKIIILMCCFCVLCACTENARSKNFGGTSTHTIPAGNKLVNVTWKENNLWFLTRPMKQGEAPETYEFRESSSLGFVQGNVIIVETK